MIGRVQVAMAFSYEGHGSKVLMVHEGMTGMWNVLQQAIDRSKSKETTSGLQSQAEIGPKHLQIWNNFFNQKILNIHVIMCK